MSLSIPVRGSANREQRTIVPGRECIVDADSLCWISNDPEEGVAYVLHSVKLTLQKIQEETEAEKIRCVFSSSTNFRYNIYPDYKLNRRGMEKPCHFEACKEYMMQYWNGEVSPDGMEADDYCAVLSRENPERVISFIDKDLYTFPGLKHKWKGNGSGLVFKVTQEDADAFLAYQLLAGDKQVDWIISPLKCKKKNGEYGASGFGYVKARDFLLQYDYPDMIQAVKDEYIRQGFEDMFEINYKLLAIGRCV